MSGTGFSFTVIVNHEKQNLVLKRDLWKTDWAAIEEVSKSKGTENIAKSQHLSTWERHKQFLTFDYPRSKNFLLDLDWIIFRDQFLFIACNECILLFCMVYVNFKMHTLLRLVLHTWQNLEWSVIKLFRHCTDINVLLVVLWYFCTNIERIIFHN